MVDLHCGSQLVLRQNVKNWKWNRNRQGRKINRVVNGELLGSVQSYNGISLESCACASVCMRVCACMYAHTYTHTKRMGDHISQREGDRERGGGGGGRETGRGKIETEKDLSLIHS